MHFEILVEDLSGKKVLDTLVPQIIGGEHTFRVLPYKGIGRIPKTLRGTADPSRRLLLERLPKLLQGYGNTFANYPEEYSAAVMVVCDLDDRCLKTFREELFGILDRCHPKPKTQFCLAIEEGEAWLLGDLPAVKAAYPHVKKDILDAYVNDSICGTWEKLADAVCRGGSQRLLTRGWQAIGAEKSKWAETIAPRMDVRHNHSPSFCYFRRKLEEWVAVS